MPETRHKFHKRVYSAAIFVPIILSIVWLGGPAFVIFIMLLVGLGLWEFYELGEKMQTHPSKILGTTGGVLLALMIYLNNLRIGTYFRSNGTAALLCGLIFVGFLLGFYRKQNMRDIILDLGVTILGIVYVGWLWGHLILLREFRPGGMRWTFLLIFVVWLLDTGCYGVGLKFGRHKLSPRISPKKTVEGALGGLGVAIGVALLCRIVFMKDLISFPTAAGIGAMVGVFAQLSDLSESLLKRAAGVKDSSNFIPGHGGILDRFDSFFFSAPALYYFLIFFH